MCVTNALGNPEIACRSTFMLEMSESKMHSVFCRVLLVNQLDITERSYTPPNVWRRPRGKVSLPFSSRPFLPRDAMRKRGLCCRPVSVCPSDRPSVRLSRWCIVSTWLKKKKKFVYATTTQIHTNDSSRQTK